MSWLDLMTRMFWRVTGRPIDLETTERWLAAPMSASSRVGDGWLHMGAAALGGTVHDDAEHAGLLPDMSQLDGPEFTANELRSEIRDFYERTSDWRMEAWPQWSAVFQPGGELISRLFGRRVQQLALPTRPLDAAHGMDSHVVPITGPAGDQRAAGWLRTLRSTGQYVFSGCYSIRRLPGSRQPSVHVAFPLEAGNVQVFLSAQVLPDGSLVLNSPGGSFGENGAYVVIDHRERAHAARLPIGERFHVYVDREGTLRADHTLHLWSARVLRIHYKLIPTSG